MKVWNFEADQIHLGDKLSVDDVITTEPIKDFLRIDENPNKLFLVASKGLGKTLMLKVKSILYRKNKSNYICLPTSEPCETVSVNAFSIKIEEFGFFEDLNNWKMIWKFCFILAILRRLNVELPSVIEDKLGRASEISDILNVIIQNRIFFLYKEPFELLSTELNPQIRSLNNQIAVFIDSLDQTMGQFVRNQKTSHPNLSNRTAVNIWANSQLGLLYAIHEICVQNKHIKIFATIREEAFELDESDLHTQIKDYSSCIKYGKSHLRSIFIKNIEESETKKLASPGEKEPLTKFFGFNELPHSFVQNRSENIFDFIYRHTFGRPRELVLIGSRIYEMSPQERTPDTVIRKVNKISHEEIFPQFKKEIIPSFNEQDLINFCKKLDSNVFNKNKARFLNQENLSFYYKLGLIGTTKRDPGSGKIVQDFRTVDKFNYKEQLKLPQAQFYFTHPALDGLLIDELGKKYNQSNIIGYQLDFSTDFVSKLDYKRNNNKQLPDKKGHLRRENKIKVFIASPSDVNKERKFLFERLERHFRDNGYEEVCDGNRIEVVGWEDIPSHQGHPQSLINEELLLNSHIVVAIFKHILGSPVLDPETQVERNRSGTVEELFKVIRKNKEIFKDRVTNSSTAESLLPTVGMLYFYSREPRISADDLNFGKKLHEWQRLKQFKDEIKNEISWKIYKDNYELLQKISNDLRQNIKRHFCK